MKAGIRNIVSGGVYCPDATVFPGRVYSQETVAFTQCPVFAHATSSSAYLTQAKYQSTQAHPGEAPDTHRHGRTETDKASACGKC